MDLQRFGDGFDELPPQFGPTSTLFFESSVVAFILKATDPGIIGNIKNVLSSRFCHLLTFSVGAHQHFGLARSALRYVGSANSALVFLRTFFAIARILCHGCLPSDNGCNRPFAARDLVKWLRHRRQLGVHRKVMPIQLCRRQQ